MASDLPQAGNRERVIVRTSILGILANLLLAALKATVGVLTNSIAVTLDAVNNMTDALSSVVTIVGTKLAGRRPDKNHPLGYGRIEYLTTMVIAAIILYAGITSLVESVGKILEPETADYSVVSLVIIAAAVFVKIALGTYVKRIGEKVSSGSLVASGKDALFDAVLSASVLASAVVFVTTGIGLEAYVGLLISLFIIKSSIEMMRDSVDDILGRRADPELAESIKATICEEEKVSGAYDLILHSYGPGMTVGSVHIEVPGDMPATEIDTLERRILRTVLDRHGVVMSGIGIYAVDTSDESAAIRSEVTRIVMSHPGVVQMHGFRVDTANRVINVDVILDYSLDDRDGLFKEMVSEVRARYPDYRVDMVLDIDFRRRRTVPPLFMFIYENLLRTVMFIVGGSSSRNLARELSMILGCQYVQAATTRFPDGECYTRIDLEGIDDDVVIVQNTYPDGNLVEAFLLQDAVRRLGAKSVTMVIPYFGYARQDRVFKNGEPESAKVMAKHLDMVCDRVITVDIHKETVLDNFTCPHTDLKAAHVIADYFKDRGIDMVMSPDIGAAGRAEAVGKRMGLPYDHLTKTRLSGVDVKIAPATMDVKGKKILIVDDMISTGGTIVAAAAALREAGAVSVSVACTHGVFVNNAIEKLTSSA
ncbi:MAG: ribose-phosphate diphosphokinase, partial [Candidatus Methanomethylophilaceae archaeon]|nr:ribose-phosphate diphosphokinase [Candidatus Methanomethylophilaceae archaeon]